MNHPVPEATYPVANVLRSLSRSQIAMVIAGTLAFISAFLPWLDLGFFGSYSLPKVTSMADSLQIDAGQLGIIWLAILAHATVSVLLLVRRGQLNHAIPMAVSGTCIIAMMLASSSTAAEAEYVTGSGPVLLAVTIYTMFGISTVAFIRRWRKAARTAR